MKASTPIGIVVCIVGILAGASIEGTPAGWPPEHPRDPRHLRRHRRREHRHLRHGGHEAHADALQEGDDAGVPGSRARPCASSSASPRRPARRACSRSSPPSRRSTTRSRRRACSSPSTAPTPTSSARSSRSRSSRWRRATASARSSSRTPAATPRRSACSAPSWASCTSCSSCRRRSCSAPPSPAPSWRRSTAWARRTSIFLPTAGRLAALTQTEVLNRTLVIEGILAIQAGENPRVVSERLLGFLPPADREAAAAAGRPDPPGRARGTGRVAGSTMARHKKEHHEEHPDERWLVTFADMMVLLVAVFIVLWAMSSANVSKTLVVAESVSKALSSPVITGGKAIKETGGETNTEMLQSKPANTSLAEAMKEAQGGTPAERREGRQGGAARAPEAQAAGRRVRERQRARQDDQHEHHARRAEHPPEHGRPLLRLRRGGAQAGVAADPGQGRRPAALRQPLRPRGRPHGHGPHRRQPVPHELGAVRLTSFGRRACAAAQPRRRRPDGGIRAIESRSRRDERDGRGACREPARRTAPAKEAGGHRNGVHDTMMSKLKILLPVLLLVGGGAYKFVLAKPKVKEPVPKVHGEVYVLPKDFLVNLSDGRFGKLSVALVFDDGFTAAPAAGGEHGGHRDARGLRRPRPGAARPRDRHRRPHGLDRRRPHRCQAPQRDRGEDRQADQEDDRREGARGALHRRRGPVGGDGYRATHERRDRAPEPAGEPRGAGPARATSSASSRSRSRSPWRSAGRT